MENHSTRCPSDSKARPRKPHKDFPLYAHKVGVWAKKVCGKTVYFTKWASDPKGVAALEMWLGQKDDLLAGREPRAKIDGLTIAEMCNQFLHHKEQLRNNGELSPRTFQTYFGTCETIVKHFNRNRAVAAIVPDDFRKLRGKLSKTRGAVALGNEITRVRTVFKFAFDEGLILVPIKFGQAFKKPRKDTIDKAREAHRLEHGYRMFEAHEIRKIIAAANQPLKAMVLLAVNTGFGNTDVSALPQKAVDLDKAWVDFARVKNATRRRVPLWPETVAAIREWLPMRPKAKDKADASLLFLTCRRQRWVKLNASGSPADAIGQEFNKVLHHLGLKRPRLSFYGLRHTFETIAGDTADQVAVDYVMGHKPKGMAGIYRERIEDDRLHRIVEHVRRWLFADESDYLKKNPGICDPTDPCDPALVYKHNSGSQRVARNLGLTDFATRENAENAEKTSAGSVGSVGSQNTRKVLEGEPRLRIVG